MCAAELGLAGAGSGLPEGNSAGVDAPDVGLCGRGSEFPGAKIAGVDAPDVGAVTLLPAVDAPVCASVVTESTDSDRGVLCRLGNIAGILNPGDSGFMACGVLTTPAGVGVAGVSVVGVRGDEGCSIWPGSAVYPRPEREGGMYKFDRRAAAGDSSSSSSLFVSFSSELSPSSSYCGPDWFERMVPTPSV